MHHIGFERSTELRSCWGIGIRVGVGAPRSFAQVPESSQQTKIMQGPQNRQVHRFFIYRNGEYMRPDGSRAPINGDTSKILAAVGLIATQKTLTKNYQFMSARIPGTRQVRRTINHLVFSSRVVYGLPVFMTVTPGERHSGLMIRLSRYRRNDPGAAPSHAIATSFCDNFFKQFWKTLCPDVVKSVRVPTETGDMLTSPEAITLAGSSVRWRRCKHRPAPHSDL